MKVFRPLSRVTAASTCRNGQCKHQTRLCTTVLWVTQWERAAWGAEHKPKESRRLKSERGIFSPWSEFSLHLEFSGKPVKLRSNPRNSGGWELLYRDNRVDVSLKEDPSSNPQKHPCSARKIPLFSRLTLKKIYFSHNVRWILDATELIIHLEKRNRWLKAASPES